MGLSFLTSDKLLHLPIRRTSLRQHGIDVYTKLLMHFEGDDASTTFIDQTGKTITRSGDAQIDTAQYKFGTSCGLFDGTGDNLTVDASDGSLNIAIQKFCIETWVRFNTVASSQYICDFRQSAGGDVAPHIIFSAATGTFKLQVGGADKIVGSTAITTNVWYNLVVARNDGITKLFVNGIQEGANFSDTSNYIAVTGIKIGSTYSGANGLNGWLDEMRISIGVPRYVSNFSVQESAFYG